MKIHNIKVTNFRSMYGEHYFDFDKLSGLVKLSGPIGAGKTSLAESILCGLFGKVKDHTNPNMVSWGTDTYEIELNLTSKGHQIHIIRNPKKQLLVEVDGKEISAPGKNDMQSVLEEFYDVPRMAIEKMSIISFNGFSSLAAMSPYETKTFLDDIFGFRTFTEYNDEVVLERKEQILASTELNAILQDTEKQIKYLYEKREAQQKELQSQIDITGLNDRRQSLIDEGISQKKVSDEINASIREETSRYDTRRNELLKLQTEAATLGKVQKDNYNKFKEGKCPTCGHDISVDVIEQYKQKMESYAADWRHYDTDLKKLREQYDNTISEHREKLTQSDNKIRQLKEDISKIDSQIKIYNNNIKLISENYNDLIKSYEDKARELSEKIVKTDTEIGEWNEMNEMFTKTLRYSLLDSLIPHINASIQYYINKLDQGYRVQYDQEFKAHIFTDNINSEISYKDLSTGQRKTLDVAIIFGILQNIIANVDFNIVFADELMSNLDAESRNTMIAVLKETLSEGRSIFVVNHAEMGDDFFDHKIRVKLVNKKVRLSKKKLKKAVDTGAEEIVARSSVYEIVM